MRKPKLLIIENATHMTGAVNSILRSSVALQQQFDFVFLLPSRNEVSDYVASKGFTVHELPMKELRKGLVRLLIYLPALIVNTISFFRLLRKIKPDLIVSNDLYNLIAPCYKLLGGKINYVVYIRFMPTKFSRILVNLWCTLHRNFAAHSIAVSTAVKRNLPYQKDVTVVGGELPLHETALVEDWSNLILFVANYIPGKGQEHAIESFASLRELFPGWKLRFVGGDMNLEKNRLYKSWLMELARSRSIFDQIEWGDFTMDVANEYLNSAFVVNFSESESFSLTCLEAMFYGRTIVATKSGGPEDIVQDGINGILVDLKDTDAMRKAMHYLMSFPIERRQMASVAYQSVREKFSVPNTAGKIAGIYQSSLLK